MQQHKFPIESLLCTCLTYLACNSQENYHVTEQSDNRNKSHRLKVESNCVHATEEE